MLGDILLVLVGLIIGGILGFVIARAYMMWQFGSYMYIITQIDTS